MIKKLKAINFFPGPGASKSTTAAGLFYKMKLTYQKVELVTEYAKELTYEGKFDEMKYGQYQIFKEQSRRQSRLIGHVDYLITDSPIFLSTVYGSSMSPEFHQMVLDEFNKYDNINFYIDRVKPYFKIGRSQTEPEARELDKIIKDDLDRHSIPYYVVKGDEICVDSVLNILKGL